MQLLGDTEGMSFRVLVIGGTGQVGSALVRALLAASACTEIVMINRRTIPLDAGARLRQVVVDTAVRSLGFKRLAIYRPGIIAGNAHTPRYLALLGHLVPGSFGTIDQDDIGRAFVGEFRHGQDGTTILDNVAMRQRSRALRSGSPRPRPLSSGPASVLGGGWLQCAC